MILSPRDHGWFVVHQYDHAAQSARLARAWRRPAGIPDSIWHRLLEAVRRHDDGWRQAEEEPLIAADGKPFDFLNYPAAAHTTIWRRSVELAARDDPYAGLLVAQHARSIYRMGPAPPARAARDAAEAFRAELEAEASACAARLARGSSEERDAVRPGARERARRLLSFFDALSLHLLGAVNLEGATEPLTFASHESSLRIGPRAGGPQVTPWPFTTAPLEVDVEGARVAGSRFATPAAFAAAVRSAPRELLSWRLGPGPGPAA